MNVKHSSRRRRLNMNRIGQDKGKIKTRVKRGVKKVKLFVYLIYVSHEYVGYLEGDAAPGLPEQLLQGLDGLVGHRHAVYLPDLVTHVQSCLHSTVQYSTVQYSTVQYSTVQYDDSVAR